MPKRILSIMGFLLAGLTAPAVSVTIFYALGALSPEGPPVERPYADVMMVYIFATAMGVIPSLVFGGLTLLAMKSVLSPWPPRVWVLSAGGLGAAALYCVVGTLVGFTPWGRNPFGDVEASGLMAICILLSGAVAGLIYAAFVRRG